MRKQWNALAALAVATAIIMATPAAGSAQYPGYALEAQAASIDRILLDLTDPGVSVDTIGKEIDWARMHMAARPGFNRKYLPFVPLAPETGLGISGGFYTFDTRQQADDFVAWYNSPAFYDDQGQVFSKAFYLELSADNYDVIGGWRFSDVTPVVVRSTLWQIPESNHGNVAGFLSGFYHYIRAKAYEAGYTEVMLLHDAATRTVVVVTLDDRSANPNWTPNQGPDFPSLGALAASPKLGGEVFTEKGWSVPAGEDRTMFVFTIWNPFVAGDTGEPAPWPNSPPFPEPRDFDGLCSPSRGETAATTSDCPLTCGDGVNDGEDFMVCPSDVPIPPLP